MSELADLHDEHNALFERYRAAHKQIARLTKERDDLREALRLWQIADEHTDAESFEAAYKAARVKRDNVLADLNKTDRHDQKT